MSRFDNFNTSDRASLEQMPTEDLREILRQSAQPESETDENTILIVLEILEKPEATETPKEVASAWERFEQKHLAPTEPERFEEEHTPKPKKHRSLAKIAGIAAAVALVIFAAGSLITPVEGTNLWNVIVNWTKETLGIGTEGKKLEMTEVPEQLAELNAFLQQYKLAEAVKLPSYIPERYKATSTFVDDRDNVIAFICQMESDTDTIFLQYKCWKNGMDASEIQKNDESPEIYTASDDTTIYITTNMDVYNAVWVKGDVEVVIYNVPSREELIQIIDSI